MSAVPLFSLAIVSLFFCGTLSTPVSRVVGGEDAEAGQFPHQVALFRSNSFTCGGSVISSRYVLTAAHCVVSGNGVEPYPAESFSVRVGSLQRTEGGKLISIKNVTVRQSYGDFLDDVALLELAEELVFDENIQKIELYEDEIPMGERVVISGWGRLSTGGSLPSNLQYNTLVALDEATCDDLIGMGQKQILCLDHKENNGACNGDSGGPAVYQGKLAGVAGFVVNGCGSGYPDGYAKVSYHRQWIEENMK